MIHTTATIEEGAIIGSNVHIGPYSVIGPNVILGDDVKISSHVIVMGYTSIGSHTQIYPYSVIGMPPQDLKYKNEITYINIGNNCTIREKVTIHAGTKKGNSVTKIGDNCFFMVSAHVGHDCIVGDNVLLINQASLGGHSQVGDYAVLGAFVTIHPFVRVGKHSYVAGMTGVEYDILPYGLAAGSPRDAYIKGVNIKGLRGRDFSREQIISIQVAYKKIFNGPGIEIYDRARDLIKNHPDNEQIEDIANFITQRPETDRHFCFPNKRSTIK